MKKIVLFILSVMAFAGMSVAQDVYSSGYYYNDNSEKVAAVYKNGNMLYSTGSTPSYVHESSDVLFLDGDVYWVDNCLVSNYDNHYSRVMKNDQVFLEIPVGLYPYITCLFTNGVDVYAGGYIRVNSYQKAMVWKNSDATPYLTFDAVNYSYGRLKDAMIVEGKVFACGDVYDTDLNATVGVIWHEDYGQLYSLGEGVVPLSMDYYDGSVYSATWDLNNNAGIVFQNDYELYTLTTNGNADVICIDAGDVYVGIYDQDQVWGSIWKNNEKVYDVSYHYGTECLVVNSEGVFYAAEGGVWKNGLRLFSLDNDPDVQGMFVDLDCQNNAIRTLPYYESFETGATDWTCWHVRDFDNQNDDNASYWHRGGENFEVNPPDGHHCAWHRYNSEFHQNGTLTSPPISIPVGGSVTMTFKTYEEWPGDYDYEGVWVATEGNDDEVWVQTEPSAEWKKVTIDLTAYQGQVVTIEFDYEGTDAHSWYIDDVMITSDFQPCPPVSAPYVERFDTGLGECMYAFETDHDGRCWEWELVYQAAFHPNGAGSNQGGALLTPNVMLSASKAYQLSFDFRAAIPSKGESSDPVEFSVWMGVDSNGLGDLGDFNEIWRRVPVASTSEFETVTIDLSPYSGHSVQFAFVYQGNGDYGWLIDNVAVVERIGVDENGPSTGSGTLVIYPNPASDRIHIEGLEADSEVQLFNAVGELVKTVKVDGNSEINITDLASGLYLVRFGNASVRFVKE